MRNKIFLTRTVSDLNLCVSYLSGQTRVWGRQEISHFCLSCLSGPCWECLGSWRKRHCSKTIKQLILELLFGNSTVTSYRILFKNQRKEKTSPTHYLSPIIWGPSTFTVCNTAYLSVHSVEHPEQHQLNPFLEKCPNNSNSIPCFSYLFVFHWIHSAWLAHSECTYSNCCSTPQFSSGSIMWCFCFYLR